MNEDKIKEYIGTLLNTLEPDTSEVQNTVKIFTAYIAGLQRKDFPLEILTEELSLEKEIPPHLQTLVLQASILKSSKTSNRATDYINKILPYRLKDFIKYFVWTK